MTFETGSALEASRAEAQALAQLVQSLRAQLARAERALEAERLEVARYRSEAGRLGLCAEVACDMWGQPASRAFSYLAFDPAPNAATFRALLTIAARPAEPGPGQAPCP